MVSFRGRYVSIYGSKTPPQSVSIALVLIRFFHHFIQTVQ